MLDPRRSAARRRAPRSRAACRRTGTGCAASGGAVLGASRRRTSSATRGAHGEPASTRTSASVIARPLRFERSATIRTSTPGSARSSRSVSGSAKPPEPAPRRRRPDQHVGRAPLARHARGDLGDVVALLDDHLRAEQRAEPVERLDLLALGLRRLARRARSARRARRPSRCAERHARRTIRCDDGCGVTSASRRSPTACGAARSISRSSRGAMHVALEPLGLDVLGHLPQRDLAQRLEVLDAEEAVERGRHARRRVDLARPAGARSAPAA